MFREEDTLENVKKINERLKVFLEGIKDHSLVGDTRCIGSVAVIELVKDKTSKEPFGLNERIGLEIYKKGLEENLLLRPLGHIIYLFLPLATRLEEVDEITKRTSDIIKSLKAV